MLVAETQACINEHAMLYPGAKVIAAVSGGPDSMALLSLLFRLRSRYNLVLSVAHVNHQLRGDASARDALFVEEQAVLLGLPFYQTRIDVQEQQSRVGLSLQHAARQLRYHFLLTLCQTLGATRVALGHTADDQAETLMIRLVHGSAPAGLAGIPAMRTPFIRPLIATSRASVYAYLRQERIAWIEDPSNKKTVYIRNRVRVDLMPKLRQYNPQIMQRLNTLAQMLRDDGQVLEEQAEALARHALQWHGPWRLKVRRDTFLSAPVALQRRVVRCALDGMQVAHLMSFRHVEGLRHFIVAGMTGKRYGLPGEIYAEHLGDEVLLWNAARLAAMPCASTLRVPGVLDLGSLNMRLIADILDGPPCLKEQRLGEGYVDLGQLHPPLCVRFWQRGDRFYPLGAAGSKKLQDFFVDSKIPRGERPYIPLVLSGEHIVWVSGHRIAEPFKICAQTRRAVRLRYCSIREDGVWV